MINTSKFRNILLLAFLAVSMFIILPMAAKAEGEGEERLTLKLAQTTANVNVRTGAGENLYPIMQYNGSNVQLPAGTSVIIIGESVVAETGRVWYNIIFYLSGVELQGWATSSYISVTGTVTATPTPTPEATDTPTPTPSDTPTPTPEPTNTPVPTEPPKINEKSGIYELFWKVVIAILVIAVVVVITIYVYNRVIVTKGKNDEINKKMKYLKTVAENPDDPKGSVTTAKRPTVRVVEESSEKASEEGADDAPDERAILRAKLDKLKQHDIVEHKFFGKGEVYDNSDVKLMEVRFGMDVRYLNKDSLAAKKLLTFEEDDSIITRKKL